MKLLTEFTSPGASLTRMAPAPRSFKLLLAGLKDESDIAGRGGKTSGEPPHDSKLFPVSIRDQSANW